LTVDETMAETSYIIFVTTIETLLYRHARSDAFDLWASYAAEMTA